MLSKHVGFGLMICKPLTMRILTGNWEQGHIFLVCNVASSDPISFALLICHKMKIQSDIAILKYFLVISGENCVSNVKHGDIFTLEVVLNDNEHPFAPMDYIDIRLPII